MILSCLIIVIHDILQNCNKICFNNFFFKKLKLKTILSEYISKPKMYSERPLKRPGRLFGSSSMDFYLSLKLNTKRPDFSGIGKKAFMNHYKF